MDKLYPAHAKALKRKPGTRHFPNSRQNSLDNQQMDLTIDDAKGKKNNQDTRIVQFCLGMSKWWNDPVHAILKELRNKHGLTWLRVMMSYHKFSNLREIFQGDLNQKLMDGIISHDFMDQPFNCNRALKLMGNVPTMGSAQTCVSYTK